MDCNQCNLKLFTCKQIKSVGNVLGFITIITSSPSYVDSLTGIPLCGLQELLDSGCRTCKKFTKCFGYFFSNRPSSEWATTCTGFEGEMYNNIASSYDQTAFNTGGQIIDRYLNDLGMNRGDLYITSAIKCYTPGGRPPTISEIENCRHHLLIELDTAKPDIVVTLGELALYAVTGVMDEDYKEIPKEAGQWPFHIIPTYNPDAVVRLNRARIKMEKQNNPKTQDFINIIKSRTRHIKDSLAKAKSLIK